MPPGLIAAICPQLFTFCMLLYPICVFAAPDTKGNEFVFPYFGPSYSILEVTPQDNTKVTMNISFMSNKSHVGAPSVFLLAPNSTFNLNLHSIITGVCCTKDTVFIVMTTEEVTVKLRDNLFGHVMLLHPSDVLGRDYLLIAEQYDVDDNSETKRVDIITIIATSANTTIHVSPYNQSNIFMYDVRGGTKANGSDINFLMGKYEVARIQCACDISGTSVSSNSPVAIFSGKELNMSTILHRSMFTRWFALPARNTWGKRFVVISAGEGVAVTVRINSMVSSEIEIHQPNMKPTVDNLPGRVPLTLNYPGITYLYMRSDIPIQVLQISRDSMVPLWNIDRTADTSAVNDSDVFEAVDGPEHINVYLVPPVEQYLNSYIFSFNQTCNESCFVSVSPYSDQGGLLLDGKTLHHNSKEEIRFNVSEEDYTILKMFLSEGFHNIDSQSPTGSFCAFAVDTSVGYATLHPLGMRMTSLYDSCVESLDIHGGLGDGLDNDCDGKIDEEQYDLKDNDRDGLTDEDTAAGVIALVIDLNPDNNNNNKGINTQNDTYENTDTALIAVIVSLSVAVLAIILVIGSFSIYDLFRRRKHVRSARITPFLS